MRQSKAFGNIKTTDVIRSCTIADKVQAMTFTTRIDNDLKDKSLSLNHNKLTFFI